MKIGGDTILRPYLANPQRGAETWGFVNPRVIPTCIAFWPEEKELNLHRKHTTLEPYYNQLYLNLGCVSHE